MPIYAYKCDSCGHAKDVLQKMSDPVLTDCPACGASTFKKQLTAAGFQLKGSGWYVTDFKNGAAATGVVSGDKTGAASESTGGGKAEVGSDASQPASKVDSNVEPKAALPAEAKAVVNPTSTPAPSSAPAASS